MIHGASPRSQVSIPCRFLRVVARDRRTANAAAIVRVHQRARARLLLFLSTSDRTRISLVFMRRVLRIQVAFEPVRTGLEHLRDAYEVVVPVRRRRIRQPEEDTGSVEDDVASKAVRRRRREEGTS